MINYVCQHKGCHRIACFKVVQEVEGSSAIYLCEDHLDDTEALRERGILFSIDDLRVEEEVKP